MSTPNKPIPPPFDWHKFPALFKEWKEVIVIIAGAVGAVFTTIGIKAQGVAQIIGYAVALILLGFGGYIAYRIKRRQEIVWQRTQLREAFEKRKLQRTTFRGLYPYQEGDVLPGHQRKREAQTIFTQITDPNFSFGVVCGDSGCGKTSVLRCALQGHLKDAEAQTGLRVLYIGSPRELSEEPGQPNRLAPVDRLQLQLAALKRDAEQASAGEPLVIIIDQFEEFFIEYKAELRAHLGAFLNALIHATPPTRILCAIRRDYLMDMRDLSPELPEPFSVKSLFPLTNFTPEQAADVIKECAELDGVALDADLPAILAEDLADGGYVRPPELQIVCTALVSNPTITAYRLHGGAKGILAQHIQSSIAICGDPKLGAQVLRALCDFPANAKRNPQTVNELLPTIDLPSGLRREDAAKTVINILDQFEAARIVQIEPQAKEDTYALVHDYLVNSVAAATDDDKTRIERANQLLRYYIAEYSDDPKNKLPLRRHRFIKKYADKTLLSDRRAQRLLKATRNARIAYITTLLLLILIFTAALVTTLNTHRTWEPEMVNRMFPEIESVPINGTIFPLPDSGRMATIMETTEAKYARLWDAKTAGLLFEKRGDDFLLDEKGEFLIVEDKSAHTVYVTHLTTGESYPLPISPAAVDAAPSIDTLVRFGEPGGVVMISGVENDAEHAADTPPLSRTPPPPREEGVKIWSILEQKELGFVAPAGWNSYPSPYLDKKASRLLSFHWLTRGSQLILWDVPSAEWITVLADANEHLLDFAVDEVGSKLLLLKSGPNNQLNLQMGDLRTGNFLFQQFVATEEPQNSIHVRFSEQGDFVILSVNIYSTNNWSSRNLGDTEKLLAIYNSSDLLPAQYSVGKELKWAYTIGNYQGPGLVYWSSDLGVHIWDITQKSPKLLPGLVLHPLKKEDGSRREKLIVIPSSDRVIVRRQDWRKELYDLKDGRKIGELDPPNIDWGISPTLDGTALLVQFTNGKTLLYSIENGRMLAELDNTAKLIAFYDAGCHRVITWTEDGRVLQYIESIKILGRWIWPTTKCHK